MVTNRMRAMILAALLMSTPVLARDPRAAATVSAGLAAQGGEAKLRALRSVAWDAVGYRNQLEQSERPEGPYLTEFTNSHEVHDLTGHRWSSTDEMTVYPAWTATVRTVVANGAAMLANGANLRPGTSDDVAYARERVALSPERLLLTALDADSLTQLPDDVLQGVRHHVVRFDLDGAPVTVFLNADTSLPTGWDYAGPLARHGYWRFAPGAVTTRTRWGFWWLARGGIHLPMQWTVETNGLPDRMFSIKRLALDAPLDETALTIPAPLRAAYQARSAPTDLEQLPLGSSRTPPVEIRPGIVLIPGSWNVTLVRQDDGVVIIEAPISSGYSARVIAEAQRRFPGLPIKAVVTTSDSWPHLAGIREYVARGVPIYALARNRVILDRWSSAARMTNQDLLAQHARSPRYHLVSGRTALGTGANRLMLYPIGGETSERQMMAYFPEHRLLYGSDPFQRTPEGQYFLPQTVSEVTDAVARERLGVDTFFMMHVGPTPWTELAPALAAAAAKQTPDGNL